MHKRTMINATAGDTTKNMTPGVIEEAVSCADMVVGGKGARGAWES